ncbi:MAG: hypothetical protein WCR42_09850 [bacterium]
MKYVFRSLLAILILSIIFIFSKSVLNQKHYKINKSEVYYIPDSPIKRDSAVIYLESQVAHFDMDSKTIKNSYDLLALDKYNDAAVCIIANYINFSLNSKDSIKRFFDNMIKSDPKNPAALILRAKYEKYSNSLVDTSDLGLLKKACRLDWKNGEVNYLLGTLYYYAFNYEYNTSKRSSKLSYYAQKARHYFSLLYKFKSEFIFKGKYPLVQVCNFLGDKIHLEDFDNIKPNKKSTYFLIESSFILPKHWETDYCYDVLRDVEIAESRVEDHSEELRDLKEAPLINNFYHKQIYRFTQFGFLSNSTAVTMENKNGKVDIYWKSRSFYSDNNLFGGSKKLTLKDWQKFMFLIKKMKFWDINPSYIKDETVIPMNDGETWILEGADNDKYNVIKKYGQPNRTPFQDCCLYLYSLTDLE